MIGRHFFQVVWNRPFIAVLPWHEMPPGGVVGVQLLVNRIDEARHQWGQGRGRCVNGGDVVRG